MSLAMYSNMASTGDEVKKISKKDLYTAAIGATGSILLGDISASEQGSLLGMNVPLPVSVGLGVGLGSVVANFASDYVTDKLFDDSTIRTIEKNVVGLGLGAADSVAGAKYLSEIPPFVDVALLGAGSYIGGKYLFLMDDSLLGKLY
jgi:hypothetical protein